MRIKPDCNICKLYGSRKDLVYEGGNCRVLTHKKGLVCILESHTSRVSKRQRNWVHLVLSRIARRELGKDFNIREVKDVKHYHLFAFKDEKKTKRKKTSRK